MHRSVVASEQDSMDEDTYLTTQYKDRESVKAVGARWDANERRWYEPAGRDLAPFAAWFSEHRLNLGCTTTMEMGVDRAGARIFYDRFW